MPWVGISGSVGTDHSVNVPTASLSGYHLLKIVSPNPNRNALVIQNQSTSIVQLILQDGAGGNVASWFLGAGTVAQNGTGGTFYSQTFKGQCNVWSANTTDSVLIRED